MAEFVAIANDGDVGSRDKATHRAAPRRTRTSSRRQKRSRDDLRALLIEAGRALLREEGFGTGAESLTFKRVLAHVHDETGIRLTNASIIGRVWENQAEYQIAVIEAVASDEGTTEVDATMRALVPLLDSLDLTSEESRWQAVHEICRVGGAANMAALRTSDNWPTWIGAWSLAAAGKRPDHRARIEEALLQGYARITQQWETIYSATARNLGLRWRDGLTARQFTIAVAALGEGCALRDRVDATSMHLTRPSAAGGPEVPWTLFGLALAALAHEFLEIDPDWSPQSEEAVLTAS
jgi:hypothetical protein